MHFLGCPVAGSTADVFDYLLTRYFLVHNNTLFKGKFNRKYLLAF